MGLLVQSSPLTLAVAGLLCVLGVARATRLWVYDAWPPVRWARDRFVAWAEQTVVKRDGKEGPGVPRGYPQLTWRAGWAPLATCPFCVAPWFALGSIAWACWSGLSIITLAGEGWWLLHTWFAMSYLAAMVVVRDEPPEDS